MVIILAATEKYGKFNGQLSNYLANTQHVYIKATCFGCAIIYVCI
jgi:hypothetical protein